MEVEEALRHADGLGGFFVIPRGADVPLAARPLSTLLAEPAALDATVDATAAALGATALPPRVAAATVHLALMARLLSPWLAASAAGASPRLDGETVRWWLTDTGGLRVGLHPVEGGTPGRLVSDTLLPLVETFRRRGVSRRITLGNAASAATSAVVVAGRVVLPAVQALLAEPALAGTGGWLPGHQDEPRWRRSSCCLLYRAPGAGTCVDCVLRRVS